jgi:predicted DNA-binding protein
MSQAITTSIRLPHPIRKKLERASIALAQGKNALIIEALMDYFQKIERASFALEAKRQSLLACKADKPMAAIWEKNIDLTNWQN